MKLRIKPGVDLGIAFEVLKDKMDECEEIFKREGLHSKAIAYGRLVGSVNAVINHCTEPETENDIPVSLFEKPGSEDLENTLN